MVKYQSNLKGDSEKMFSFMNIARTLLAKLLTFVYSLISVVLGGISIKPVEMPKRPDDFTPVVRFAVCSDVHLNGEKDQAEAKRFAKLINFMYDYSSKQEYKNFDALVLVGDIATTGYPVEYQMINEIIDTNLKKDETKLLTCLGNHEYIAYRDVDASEGTRVFEEQMQRDDKEHAVINGYHFIISSYDEDGKSFTKKSKWIDKELKAAVKDTGDKPVFVFQHPAPFGTIYGSVNWGDPSMPLVFSKYPQVIDFSGHSHYPVNDPRSVWQGTYTAFGCGTLSYYETELDGIAGNFPYDTSQAAQFYIVEADAEGNVSVMPYDLITDQFFSNDYYLTGLADRNYDYAFSKMKARDKKPVFLADTEISTYVNDKGETILTFTGADDNFVTESYKVSVSRGIIPVFSDNFSGKYMYLFEEDCYEVNLGVLKSGKKHKVQIVALNAYAETSKPLTYNFVAE